MNHISVVLPHFARRGREVFFLASRRPALILESDEVGLFDAIDGRTTTEELAASHGHASARIRAWSEAHVVCRVPPPDRRIRERLVVIEPHMDDAMLGVGGSLLRMANEWEVTLLSVVRWSTFTSYEASGRGGFSDVSRVSALRLAESTLAARFLGGRHVALSEYDEPLLALGPHASEPDLEAFAPLLRESRSELQQRKLMNHARQTLGLHADETERLAGELQRVLLEIRPSAVWMPLGIAHFDHIRTRRACLRLFATWPRELNGTTISFYEEVPYANRSPEHVGRLRQALHVLGITGSARREDISAVYDRKLEGLSIYASQWKLERIAGQIPTTESFVDVKRVRAGVANA